MLVRMINGILRYSPSHLLHEIILYDDLSESDFVIEGKLKEYAQLKGGQWQDKVKWFRASERQGLIRAKARRGREFGLGEVYGRDKKEMIVQFQVMKEKRFSEAEWK